MLDDLGGVYDVELAPGELGDFLQQSIVDGDAELARPYLPVVGELDADGVAADDPLPVVDGKAEAAAHVEQRTPAGRALRHGRPDRFPHTAADFDIETPEIIAALADVGEVCDAGRIVVAAAAMRAAGERECRM